MRAGSGTRNRFTPAGAVAISGSSVTRLFVLGVALTALAAPPGAPIAAGQDAPPAGKILYATAATTNRIHGFCVGRDGRPAPQPSIDVPTRGPQPRRLLVKNGVLFVAELDRVEAFRIGPRGGLRREPGLHASTERLTRMSPRDLAVDEAGTMLYVPQRRQDRIAAYRLVDGLPAERHETCVQGPPFAGYRDVVVTDARLYVSSVGARTGRVEVFAVGADGALPASGEACEHRAGQPVPDATPPTSERRRLRGPKALVLDGDVLYVQEKGRRRISAFRLTAGEFMAPTTEGRKTRWQRPESRTRRVGNYEDLVQFGTTLFVSQFSRGRIDAFRLNPGPALPRRAARSSRENLRLSPVRMTVDPDTGTLYVAAGIYDRVIAYDATPRADGAPPPLDPIGETDALPDSFPNDVAVAPLAEACR
jgi:6-phosphogluconolactonase (cycloisomerase 2 family)